MGFLIPPPYRTEKKSSKNSRHPAFQVSVARDHIIIFFFFFFFFFLQRSYNNNFFFFFFFFFFFTEIIYHHMPSK